MKVKKVFLEKVGLFLIAVLILTRFSGDFLPLNLTLLILVTISGLVSIRYFFPEKQSKIGLVMGLWIIFNILIILSFVWTNAPKYGFSKLYLLYCLLLIPIIFGKSWVRHHASFRKIFFYSYVTFLVILFATSGTAIINKLIGTAISVRFGFTDSTNPNVIAVIISFGCITGFSLLNFSKKNFFLRKRNYEGLLIIFVILLSVIILFFSGSKGAVLACFGSFLLFFLIKNLTIKGIYLLVGFGIMILPFFFIDYDALAKTVLSEDLYNFVELRYLDDSKTGSVSSRVEQYTFAFDGFINGFPIKSMIGHGVGDYGYFFTGKDFRVYPHNIVFELLYEQGLLGALSFCIIVACIMYKNRTLDFDASPELKWIFICCYFFLLRAQTTGDIAGNFLLFSYITILLKAFNSNTLIISRDQN